MYLFSALEDEVLGNMRAWINDCQIKKTAPAGWCP